MRRVIAYVDGFNLYHAIDALGKPHLKWGNLRDLAASICGPDETLVQVYYFTALATWRSPAAIGRHREYIKALKHAGVTCVVGHFKEKHRKCLKCGAAWIAHEEKETDVAIATNLIADAFQDRFDRALIISADSDLTPAIECVRMHFPKKAVNVVAPPGRWGHARDLKPILEIAPGRIEKIFYPKLRPTPWEIPFFVDRPIMKNPRANVFQPVGPLSGLGNVSSASNGCSCLRVRLWPFQLKTMSNVLAVRPRL
jgi:uncharacterized LabA/DUF88 family protein